MHRFSLFAFACLCLNAPCARSQAANSPVTPSAQTLHLGHGDTTTPGSSAMPSASENAADTGTASEKASSHVSQQDFTGNIGTDSVILNWQRKADGVSGRWSSHAAGQSTAFAGKFSRTPSGAEQVVLVEDTPKGAPPIELILHVVSGPDEAAQHWEGTRSDVGNHPTQAVSLPLRETVSGASNANRYSIAGATDAAATEANAEGFRKAMLVGNAAEAAKHIAFPLVVTVHGRRSLVHSEGELRRALPQLLTPAFIAALKADQARDMVATERGVRLGSGAVWFDANGKAISIDNEPVQILSGKHFMSNRGYTPQHRKQP